VIIGVMTGSSPWNFSPSESAERKMPGPATPSRKKPEYHSSSISAMSELYASIPSPVLMIDPATSSELRAPTRS
jgi:hypothetical protein